MSERINMKCPSCNGSFIFIGKGGYLTCGYVDCPEPDIAKKVTQLEARIICEIKDGQVERKRCLELEAKNEALRDALNHCGYDPNDCIDCGGPPHNEWCRFWKVRHLLSYWDEEE